MSSTSYTIIDTHKPLEGLGPATPIPSHIFEAASLDMTHAGITSNLFYFSLGLFYIDVELLEAHHTQRSIDSGHIQKLLNSYEEQGPQRLEHPGVIIGLGQGWNDFKNTGPHFYRIRATMPSLEYFCGGTSGKGPIGQVIRGGHRTEAVKRFSELPGKADEGYWCFNVLVPSKSKSFNMIHYNVNCFTLETNQLPSTLLMDYSCYDNLVKDLLPNSMARGLNYAQVVETLYQSQKFTQIKAFIGRHNNNVSKNKITSFTNILKYREAVPQVIRLLRGGGALWIGDWENTYAALAKCRVEKVSSSFL